MYTYPKSLLDLKDKDKFEVKHMLFDIWINPQIYNTIDCRDRKSWIRYLITNNRIRVKINEYGL